MSALKSDHTKTDSHIGHASYFTDATPPASQRPRLPNSGRETIPLKRSRCIVFYIIFAVVSGVIELPVSQFRRIRGSEYQVSLSPTLVEECVGAE